jgi:hypothetical protein
MIPGYNLRWTGIVENRLLFVTETIREDHPYNFGIRTKILERKPTDAIGAEPDLFPLEGVMNLQRV